MALPYEKRKAWHVGSFCLPALPAPSREESYQVQSRLAHPKAPGGHHLDLHAQGLPRDLRRGGNNGDPTGQRNCLTSRVRGWRGGSHRGSPTVVLAVRAHKAWAAPPGHGGQHLLLDLVHRLLCHAIPGERGGQLSDSRMSQHRPRMDGPPCPILPPLT